MIKLFLSEINLKVKIKGNKIMPSIFFLYSIILILIILKDKNIISFSIYNFLIQESLPNSLLDLCFMRNSIDLYVRAEKLDFFVALFVKEPSF
jgi:hypothetical protein